MFRCLGALGGVDAEEHSECVLRHCTPPQVSLSLKVLRLGALLKNNIICI
jgi:hypothetical protein